jgi:hypothetical protein
MSQDKRRLSEEDMGSGSPSNTGENLRDYNNPSRSVSLMGSSPTNMNNNNTSTGLPTKLARRKSYDVSDDDYNDDNGNNRRIGLRKRPSYRSHKSTNSERNENEDNDEADDESLSESDHEFTLKDRQEVSILNIYGQWWLLYQIIILSFIIGYKYNTSIWITAVETSIV